MNVQKSRTPLVFTNVAFEDYIDSFSPSKEKDSIPRKFMSQSQIGIFRFGHSETQENCAFVCIVRPLERKLSSEAPEFIPRYMFEYSSDNSDFLETPNPESFCWEQSLNKPKIFLPQTLKMRFSQIQNLKYVQISMPKSLSNDLHSEFSTSNTSEHDSMSDSEESPTQAIATDIYVHTPIKQELNNAPMVLSNPRIDIPICPSFKNMNITIMSSVDLERREKEQRQQLLLNDQSSLRLKPKFTRKQKEKWPQTNFDFVTKRPCVSTWVVDSGCSRHMTGTLKLLSSYIKQEGSSVAFGGNQKGKTRSHKNIPSFCSS
ncbi:hypothetical protein OSB04_011537 [Centaurea solstitialis]|uniref:Retrovirus-related Pol polyprotein from transposon TNT 1-94-like beta-barrel domain-containing protein n=1 Tax=Centaurea solstitialis TaxID=347529 RepID=A0AA38TH63_9ASTR|nr:hypothetical protein OSB04_011537 [Centaurea solstitialis]